MRAASTTRRRPLAGWLVLLSVAGTFCPRYCPLAAAAGSEGASASCVTRKLAPKTCCGCERCARCVRSGVVFQRVQSLASHRRARGEPCNCPPTCVCRSFGLVAIQTAAPAHGSSQPLPDTLEVVVLGAVVEARRPSTADAALDASPRRAQQRCALFSRFNV